MITSEVYLHRNDDVYRSGRKPKACMKKDIIIVVLRIDTISSRTRKKKLMCMIE
jgi:hypothetical protein